MNLFTPKEAIEELKTCYCENTLIPFIGAGFSNPLGLPTWSELVGDLAKKLKYDPELFALHGSYQQLLEYVRETKSKFWEEFIHDISVQFDSEEFSKKRKNSKNHKALASLNVKTIYTTNYDRHIESALMDNGKKCVALASLADFLEPRELDLDCEVIKFHGTLSQQETIVLTESEYFSRMELEEAVDQRLRSDLLSNSFLFIGYSFSDPNIRYIWYKIHKLLHNQNRQGSKIRPSYLISFGYNPIQNELLSKRNIKVISFDPSNKEETIGELLNELAKK